ncbi:T9SS type A sorting domain-containing protein [Pseudopedobacter beijingensis]|uniref:T9SS type A sorting domain-containing protein n=1 Tax=Pseudopedobacter beijingensis TaxID=1207056 RepID=A0ABW4IEG3_9SPHI
MNRKSIFYLVLILIVGINAHAFQAPVSLSLQGSAAESTTPIPMKLVGTVYELYTSLKTGNYSFAGDNSIAQASITVTESLAPYRIRVNYSGSTPTVEIKKITRVSLWAPWNKFTIAELAYVGNSVFRAIGLSQYNDAWGDNRYRIKVFLEGNVEETYQPENNVENPDESTPLSYYDLYFGPNGDWPSGAKEYKIFNKYRNTGILFDAEVSFKTDANYSHRITDYVPSLTITDNLSISGSALESGSATFKKKENGIFEFVGGLQAGSFTISGTKEGTPYSYTLDNGQVIQGNTSGSPSSSLKPYYLKINLINGSYILQEVTAVNLFMSFSGFLGSDRIQLLYQGNGKFQGSKASLVWPVAGWGEDSRYKFKMDLANSTSVYWASSVYDNTTPPNGETIGSYYSVNSVINNDYDYAFKFQQATNNQQLSIALEFNSDGNFSHRYVTNGTLPFTLVDFRANEENGKVKLVWKTESEENFSGFEVERSIDGVYFETLGKVRSNQQSGLQQYLLYDQNVADFLVIYYRLKMVDNDGTTRFSNVIALKITALKENVLKVYNLSDSYLQVVHPNANNNAQIEIYGIDGKIINSIKANQGEVTSRVNVSNLKNGVYVLSYKDEVQLFRTKFIK